MDTNRAFIFFMKQNTTFSAQSFIASCVASSLIIVWKGHSSLCSKHQFHKNKVFRRRNPFSSDELGTDARQRCSCFPTVSFLSKPWIGFYEADHVERHYGGSVQRLAPNAVPPPPPVILPLDLSLCRPYLFLLSFLYFCWTLISPLSSHQESLSWMLGACLPKIATTHHQ